MSQPNLLELEAPIKICGRKLRLPVAPRVHIRRQLELPFSAQATSTGSTQTCYGCLSTGGFHPRPTIYSWGTMLTVASKVWKPYACCLHTRYVFEPLTKEAIMSASSSLMLKHNQSTDGFQPAQYMPDSDDFRNPTHFYQCLSQQSNQHQISASQQQRQQQHMTASSVADVHSICGHTVLCAFSRVACCTVD